MSTICNKHPEEHNRYDRQRIKSWESSRLEVSRARDLFLDDHPRQHVFKRNRSKKKNVYPKIWWSSQGLILFIEKLGGGSNIFYFHPYLGKISNLTNIFQMGWNHQLGNVFVTLVYLPLSMWDPFNPLSNQPGFHGNCMVDGWWKKHGHHQTMWNILQNCVYTLELPPTQDSSHHQDYSIFSRESQPKPSCVTGTGWGLHPIYTYECRIFSPSILWHYATRSEAIYRTWVSSLMSIFDGAKKYEVCSYTKWAPTSYK